MPKTPEEQQVKTGLIAAILFLCLIAVVAVTFGLNLTPNQKLNARWSQFGLTESDTAFLNKTVENLKRSQTEEDLKALENIVSRNNRNLHLRKKLVEIYEQSGKLTHASMLCRDNVEFFDGDLESIYKLAELYLARKKTVLCYEFLVRKRHYFQNDLRRARISILLHLQNGDQKGARHIYEEALKKNSAETLNSYLSSWSYANILKELQAKSIYP